MTSSGPPPVSARRTVAIIGGGISGLAAAAALTGSDRLEIQLFEASPRLGGVVGSERHGEFLIERGADCFLSTDAAPWAGRLVEDLGLADQLLATASQHRRAYVYRSGLHRVPAGFRLFASPRITPILSTRLLSWRGRARVLRERWVPPAAADQEESVEAFGVRRVGREAFDWLVQPLASGIHTADPSQLSMAAAFPEFVQMERRFGSLARGLQRGSADRQTGGARYARMHSLQNGMQTLVDRLTERLPAPSVHRACPVRRLAAAADGGWHVVTDREVVPADAAIVALPAHRAADVLSGLDPVLAQTLNRIPYAGSCVVSLGYHRDRIAHPLHGFGVVVPAVCRQDTIAVSFASIKFPHRAPAGHVLFRCFLGGALRPELLDRDDEELAEIARRGLQTYVGAEGLPLVTVVQRWPSATPQYTLGHLGRVQEIDTRLRQWPRLALAGAALRGIGIPQCVHSGQQAADRVRAALGQRNLNAS